MAALCNSTYFYFFYIFALWFLLLSIFFFFFSLSNLSSRGLDVYHSSTHGVALVRIRLQIWNVLHAARWKCRTQKIAQNSPSGHHRTTLSGYIFATKPAHTTETKQRKTIPKQNQNNLFWVCFSALYMWNKTLKQIKSRCGLSVNQTLRHYAVINVDAPCL